MVHAKSHFTPSQLAWVAPVGTGQVRHEGPHALTSISDGHNPPHRCWLVRGQPPAQEAFGSMQAPLQSCLPSRHMPPQVFPSQVATPSIGESHGVQDAPQVLMSLLATQPPGQVCMFGGHSGAAISTPPSRASPPEPVSRFPAGASGLAGRSCATSPPPPSGSSTGKYCRGELQAAPRPNTSAAIPQKCGLERDANMDVSPTIARSTADEWLFTITFPGRTQGETNFSRIVPGP